MRVHSQSDLVPSFELWLKGATELAPFQWVMFGHPAGPAAANCAFHSRGDRRGLVEVACDAGRGQVRLDGDETRFTPHDGIDQRLQRKLLDHLAVLRLEGLERHRAAEITVE